MPLYSVGVNIFRWFHWTVVGLVAVGSSALLQLGVQPAQAGTNPSLAITQVALMPTTGQFYGLTSDPSGDIFTVDDQTCDVYEMPVGHTSFSQIGSGTSVCHQGWQSNNLSWGDIAGQPTLISAMDGFILEMSVPTSGTNSWTQVASPLYASDSAIYDQATDTLFLANDDHHGVSEIAHFSACTANHQCTDVALSQPGNPYLEWVNDLALAGTTIFGTPWATADLASIPAAGGTPTFYGTYSTGGGAITADSLGNVFYNVSYSGNTSGTINELAAGTSTPVALSLSNTYSLLNFAPAQGLTWSNGVLYAITYDTVQSQMALSEVVLGPHAPTGITAQPGNATATVNWGAVQGATSYRVSLTPGSHSCTVTAPATSCSVAGLTNGVTYTAQVLAMNGTNPSGWSTPVSVTPKAPVKPEVTTTTAKSQNLPATGSGLTLLLGLGGLLTVSGSLVVRASRRRRTLNP